MVGRVAPLVQDADKLEFIHQDFRLLGGHTWRVPLYILVMDGRVAPLVVIADTGEPCEGSCGLVTCIQIQLF